MRETPITTEEARYAFRALNRFYAGTTHLSPETVDLLKWTIQTYKEQHA
jgi:hypothetical protein